MKKFILLAFLLLTVLSFSKERFVNMCRITSKSQKFNSLNCKSLESGKNFTFHLGKGMDLDEFIIGEVYRMDFVDDPGYFLLTDFGIVN